MHPACLPDDELLKKCTVGRGRSGGPGGQHRNKVETHVTITHKPTGLIGQAGERRSQHENKSVAIFRLRLLLATQRREPLARGETGSTLWRSRLSRGASPGEPGRIACNPEHADFPALLAEAMDVLADSGHDPRVAGPRLLVTPTQLVRFIADHPPAIARVNELRTARGMRALR